MTSRRLKSFAGAAVLALAAGIAGPMASMPVLADGQIQTIRINAGGQGPKSERIVLGLNKAIVLELPTEVDDIMVSNPAIADAVARTPRRIYVLGTGIGQTNAFFFAADGRQLLNLEIRVERDIVDLRGQIADVAPNSDIQAEALNDNVVLSGTAANIREADAARDVADRFGPNQNDVQNSIGIVGGEQVMLKVRVAEMQRTVAKQLGIDMGALFEIGGGPINFRSVNSFSLLGRALSSDTFLNIGDLETGGDAEAIIRAFERVGILRTLAEPNLTAVSGEAANFLAGGEFPVPTARDRDGNVTITFKPFGVGLGFTPVVLDEGRISLRISTEVSELTTDGAFFSQGGRVTDEDGNTIIIPGITIPALRVRRAETTVELPSGGSLVMAGLLQEQTKQNIEGIPGAKDVPVLGALFRSSDFQNNETELVVIVTPYLVKPVAATALASPTDGFAPSADPEAFLLGHLNLVYGKGDEAAAGRIEGPVGFIVE